MKKQAARKELFPKHMLIRRAHALNFSGRAGPLTDSNVIKRPATEALLETELGNGWMVVEWIEIQSGRRVVAEVTICPAPPPLQAGAYRARMYGDRPEDGPVPPGGITARLLRTVKVGKYPDRLLDNYRRWVKKEFGVAALKRLDEHVGRPSRRRRRRPRTRRASDLYYAKLAGDYAMLWQRGIRTPTMELSKLRGLPLEKMRSHIHLARANGLLPETTRGKAGGVLTPKARQILDAVDADEVTRKAKR